MESRGGQEGLVSVPQVDTLSSETQSCGLLAHPYHPVKTALHFLLSAPSFSPCWVASQKPAWFHPGHALGSMPMPHGPSPGTRGCSFSSCCQASHSLAGAPQLLLPEGGCDGCAHNKAPAETIAQECIRFLTNTVWARTIALDSRPRNTFHGARVRVACLPEPAHIPLYAKDLNEDSLFPTQTFTLRLAHAGPPLVQPFFLRVRRTMYSPRGPALVAVLFLFFYSRFFCCSQIYIA